MDQQQPAPPPQWSPTPEQPGGWGQAGYAPPARPGGVTFAGIFLIVIGVLMLLGAALFFMGGALLGGSGGAGEASGLFAAMAGIAGVLLLVWGLANLLGGIGALQGKGWGRVTGIVVSVIAVVLGILGLVTSLGQGVEPSGLVINVLILAGYTYSAWALYQARNYFAYRR